MVEIPVVLLVEDNEDDAFLFCRAVEKSGKRIGVRVVENGQEAIDYLAGSGRYGDRKQFPFPKIIVTDNRMPVMPGWQFLQWLKEQPELNMIPTVVLGGSDSMDNVERAYRLGVRSYFFKPADQTGLQQMVQKLLDYWDNCVIPPGHQEAAFA